MGKGVPKTKILFGRKDQLDAEGLKRFADSIFRLLDGMWRQLGIREVPEKPPKERNFTMPVERMLFAMVANRVLNPSGKLCMEHWIKEEARFRSRCFGRDSKGAMIPCMKRKQVGMGAQKLQVIWGRTTGESTYIGLIMKPGLCQSLKVGNVVDPQFVIEISTFTFMFHNQHHLARA